MTSPLVERLKALAPTKTQAEAAKITNVSRQRVHQLADDHGIIFAERSSASVEPRCRRCAFPLNGATACLRCRWTPARIRRLRKRLGLSQVALAHRLGVHGWSVQRWEARRNRPNAASLDRLEALESGAI